MAKMKLKLFDYSFLATCFMSVIIIIEKASGDSFIDTNHPILILDDTSSSHNYFGYSLSGVASQGIAKIYVGAPNSSSTTQNAGSVWECNVKLNEDPKQASRQSQSSYVRCNPSKTNNAPRARDTRRCCQIRQHYFQDCPGPDALQGGMWLGGTVQGLDNQSFISCGHRYAFNIITNEMRDQRMSGICYHHTPQGTSIIDPPLLPSEEYTLTRNRVATTYWMYGQMGISVALDSHHVLLGTPGWFQWHGNAILYSLDGLPRNHQCQGDNHFTTLFKTNNVDDIGRDGDSYMGYKVAIGRYPGSAKAFAVGAPRGVQPSALPYLSGHVTVASSPGLRRETEDLYGDQLGSYFGSVLEFVDLDGDGSDELLVGAPQYTSKSRQAPELYDEGCVFVYSKQRRVKQLRPATVSGSRFGSAIANLGDINHDGIMDVAIGAPGGGPNRLGEVYIYYGSKDLEGSLLWSSNPQVISAEAIHGLLQQPQGMKGFGSTLLGQVDIDANGTPDFVIGSWQSDFLVLYRTRMKMDMMATTKAYSQNKEIYKIRRDDTSILVEFCVSAQRAPRPRMPGPLDIQIVGDFGHEDRFVFAESKSNMTSFTLNSPTANKVCRNVSVERTTKELETENPKEFRIDWTMTYNNTFSNVWSGRAVTISKGPSRGTSQLQQIQFCTWCPRSTQKKSDPQIISIASDNCDDDGDATCISDLEVKVKFAGNGRNTISYTIGSGDKRTLEVSVENRRETAYDLILTLDISSLPSILGSLGVNLISGRDRWNRLESEMTDEKDKKVSKRLLHSFRCRYPLHTNRWELLKFEIAFDSALTAMKSEERVNFNIIAQPGRYVYQKREASAALFVVSDGQVVLRGVPNERQDVQASNVIFRNSYLLQNEGRSPVSKVNIRFEVPEFYVDENEALIPVVKVYEPLPYNSITCARPDGREFAKRSTFTSNDRTGLQGTNGSVISLSISRRRRRRQTNMNGTKEIQKEDLTASPSVRGGFSINCGELSVWKCTFIQCQLNPDTVLASNNRDPITIFLSFALTNESEAIIPLDSTIIFTTKASIWTFDESEKSFASAVTSFRGKSENSIPAWLVIAGGVGGLTTFFLLTYCLFKCGFFRRKTKENLKNLKAEAEQEDLSQNFNVQNSLHED